MTILRQVLAALTIVWFANLLIISDARGRRVLLTIAALIGALGLLTEWAARHQHHPIARRLFAPRGPAFDADSKASLYRASRWCFAWCAAFALATFGVLSALLSSESEMVQTVMIWLLPFVLFATVLALASGILLLAHGLRRQ